MTQIDLSYDDDTAGSRRRPARLRWILRGVFAFCAVMITIVLLSYPPITARVQGLLDQVSAYMPKSPVASSEGEGARPTVRSLQQTSVPVRRGVATDN